jgi:hypothetical protein
MVKYPRRDQKIGVPHKFSPRKMTHDERRIGSMPQAILAIFVDAPQIVFHQGANGYQNSRTNKRADDAAQDGAQRAFAGRTRKIRQVGG